MKIKAIILSVASAALVAAPLAANAASAQRGSAPVDGQQDLGGASLVIGAIAAAAVIAGIILIADDNSSPVSP